MILAAKSSSTSPAGVGQGNAGVFSRVENIFFFRAIKRLDAVVAVKCDAALHQLKILSSETCCAVAVVPAPPAVMVTAPSVPTVPARFLQLLPSWS